MSMMMSCLPVSGSVSDRSAASTAFRLATKLYQFFVNDSRLMNSWLKIRLRGRKTNYYGAGATIKVVGENRKGEKIVRYALIDLRTGFGSSPYLAHIGLMDAARVERIEVYWPAPGCRQSYQAELNKLNLLDEGDCFRED